VPGTPFPARGPAAGQVPGAAGLPLAPLSDPDAALYTMGQAGDLLGVPAATLRRVEASGAVTPARSAGGQRRYSQRELEHVGRLLQLMDEGLTLAAANRVADLEDTVTDLRHQLDERPG